MLARIFISIIRLSPSLQKGLWKWWYQRLAHRGRDADWAFMNYGFTPKNGGPALVLKEKDESDRPFIELYNYTASQIPIKGLNVLEIGSGRGGGSSFIARYHEPAQITGLDYSPQAIELSSELHRDISNLNFIQGDAESLPFNDRVFDAIINVESSHCYGNMAEFVNEVARVLKPNGYFSWVDLRGKDMIGEVEEAFSIEELRKIKEATITTEVIEALDDIHERKMEVINQHVPRWIQPAFRDFSGVKGSKIYNGFKDGSAVYLAKVFQKV